MERIITAYPGPPYDFRGVLYLVPNQRSVRTLQALFMRALKGSTGAPACVPPHFETLNRFMGARAGRAFDRPVMEELVRVLVLEELCEKAAGRVKGAGLQPETVGRSIAPLVAEALDRMYVHGTSPDLSSDSLPVRLLLDVKKRYEEWLASNGLADPAIVKSLYVPRPDEFAGYGTVVLDGFYDADPAETRLLSVLSKASDCHFVLEAPGLARQESRGEGMPYFGADSLLEALGALPDVSGQEQDGASKEAELVMRALFMGRPLRETESDIRAFGGPMRKMRMVGAINPAEEVYFIAYDIKRRFLDGEIKDLDRVLVFFKEPDRYLPLIEEAFTDLGIPYHASRGYPLMQSPVVLALMDMLAAAQGGYTFRDVRRVLASPLFTLADGGNQAEAFDRFAREVRIPGGKTRWLAALAEPRETPGEAGLLDAPLKRLFSLTGPFEAGTARLSDWVERARALIEGSGLSNSVKDKAEENPALGAAMDALNSVLEEIAGAAGQVPRRVGPGAFVYVLKRALSGKRYWPPSPPNPSSGGRGGYMAAGDVVAGVRLLDRNETLSEPFDVVYLGGLLENVLPAPRKKKLFFHWPQEERTRDARLFIGLLLGAGDVCLTYPESRGSGQTARSPYLRALEPFVRTGWIDVTKKASRTLNPSDALSPSELLRSIALLETASGRADTADAARMVGPLPSYTPGIGMARAALAPASVSAPLTPPDRRTFTVTELEEYMLCHYRYYQGNVLKSAPEDEPEDDIAPHKAGSIIHKVLKEFYDRNGGPVTPENIKESLALLRGIAKREFARLPDTVSNRDLAERFSEFLAPRFIETEASLQETGYGVCRTELPVEIEVDDPDFGHIVITGKIDRLELDNEGEFIVTDYKTGWYDARVDGQFQLPVYAGIVREKGAELLGTDKPPRPSQLVYYNLKKGGYRDVVVYDRDAADPRTKKNFKKRGRSLEEMDSLVTESLEKAKDAVRGILKAEFAPTCEDARVCERCVYLEICVRGKGNEGSDGGTAGGESGGGEDAQD